MPGTPSRLGRERTAGETPRLRAVPVTEQRSRQRPEAFTGPNTVSIPGLTGFATTGAMMDGLSVQAVFSGGLNETLLWADTGATSGGVTGSGWSLSLTGDSFTAPWTFTFSPNASLGQLQLLVLDGRNALTIFDRTLPNTGTPSSAQGRDWECFLGNCNDATVTYDYAAGIGADLPVGDLWQVVSIDFGDLGPRDTFQFRQDTDNDSRLTQVPEPGVIALLGLTLAAMGFARRRARAL
jgi:hypothetical protein